MLRTFSRDITWQAVPGHAGFNQSQRSAVKAIPRSSDVIHFGPWLKFYSPQLGFLSSSRVAARGQL